MQVLKWSDLKSDFSPTLKCRFSRLDPALKVLVDPALLESLPQVVSAEEFENRAAPASNKGISLKPMLLVQCCFNTACMHGFSFVLADFFF